MVAAEREDALCEEHVVLSRPTVDGFVPETHKVNLRIVSQEVQVQVLARGQGQGTARGIFVSVPFAVTHLACSSDCA